MVRTGKGKKTRAGVLLLTVIFGLGLACLALPQEAASQVTTAWVKRFHGTVDGYNKAKAMALDSQGNIYVTGLLEMDETGYVCATIKYGPDGRRLWVRRYLEPGTGWDEPSAMAVDSQGNIYVTGWAEKGGAFLVCNYLTIKYSSDGQKLWVRHYKGPGIGDVFDRPSGIAVDSQGNVYVTGASKGRKTGYDYLTIKYSPEGQRLWTRRYNGTHYDDNAAAIAVDAQGNVYVTGTSQVSSNFSDRDYVTIKYNPDGKRLWVRRYNGPGDGPDRANSIALDGQGNVIVSGSSYGGLSGSDYLTIKYTGDGRRLWVRRYHGSVMGYEEARAMTIDNQGNVLVTGASWGDLGTDFATVKYSPDGQQLWVSHYNNWGTYTDYASALAVDGQGNVYVTGTSTARKYESGNDIATIKYDPDGQQLWVCRYDGPPHSPYNYDFPVAIAVDGQGNVYVTGMSEGGGTRLDYLTIKYTQTP